MRVAVIATNGYLDKQILRLLQQHGINGDIEHKLNNVVVSQYDCLILSYKNEIPNMPIVLERIALQKDINVVYVTNTNSIGQFYNVYKDLYVNFVQELTMEVELPVTLKLIDKYLKEIKYLHQEKNDLQEQLSTIKQTNSAKRILISRGLTEDEAHQFIQKKAMDLRLSKKQVVNLIIENKIDF